MTVRREDPDIELVIARERQGSGNFVRSNEPETKEKIYLSLTKVRLVAEPARELEDALSDLIENTDYKSGIADGLWPVYTNLIKANYDLDPVTYWLFSSLEEFTRLAKGTHHDR